MKRINLSDGKFQIMHCVTVLPHCYRSDVPAAWVSEVIDAICTQLNGFAHAVVASRRALGIVLPYR